MICQTIELKIIRGGNQNKYASNDHSPTDNDIFFIDTKVFTYLVRHMDSYLQWFTNFIPDCS